MSFVFKMQGKHRECYVTDLNVLKEIRIGEVE
jgi:hypothetical protein